MSERPTAYLVDGMAYVFRAFYAIGQGLTASDGTPTNAVFGFKNILQKLMRQEQPHYLAVVFDERGPTFRHEADPTYKANRKRMPDELAVQIPLIHRLVEAHNIPKLSKSGYEADDIIGTLARRLEAEGLDVVLVTGDKDLCQLVTPHVTILDWKKEERITVGEAEVEARFGVEPARVIEVLGLMGDASDNVPGVPGIGEKTAKKLLATYGTIEELLARVDEVKQKKWRESLIEHAGSARHSRKMVTIDMEVPIEIGLDALKFEAPDTDALRTLYEELEFKSELQALGVAEAPKEVVPKHYRTILTWDDLDAEIAALQQADGFAIDTETTSQDPMLAELVGISLAHMPHEAVYIPVAHRYEGAPEQLNRDEVLERLRPLLEDPSRPKYGQNIKYDLIVLKRHGVDLRGIAFDTMVAGYLLNPSRRANNLEALAKEYLDYTPISYEDVAGKGAKQITFDQVAIEQAAPYSSEDADVSALLVDCQKPKLAEHQLDRLFNDIEMPLIDVLADLEMRGITVDADYLQDMSERLQIQMDAMMEDIYNTAGEEFNINSSQQLQKILFEKLKLPTGKKTKTGYSTDVSVLEQLAFEHALPEYILDYRHLSKMKSTYIDALPQLIHPETRRIHTSLNQAITETGRLSSSNPNLQNIPIRSDLGRQIRRAFVAAPGHRLISADYSQIELRLLAHFTEDPVLTEAFRQGEDIHTRTAMDVFTVDAGAVDGDMRRMAKTVNFGIIYGLSPYGLASRLHITNEDARNYIDNYFARYPLVKSYLDGIIEEAREQGYVTTLMQRRRYLPEMNNRNRAVREAAERTAINMPFQGSAADLIKLAMVQLHQQIITEHLPCQMLLQIHDELLFEIPEAAVDEMVPRIVDTMEHVWSLEVPLTVEVGQGDNWAEAH